MITANIICDSVNPAGVRLTTFVLTYPRFIHAEFMTHRMISRNAASSRAIPIEKMMEAIFREAATPEYWAKNQSGMQAAEQLKADLKTAAFLEWMSARDSALGYAKRLQDLGLHKAIVNRVLEPFSHITVVATASSWTNFFALRAHPMAQQEFQVLAFRMLDKYLKSPGYDHFQQLKWGQWHLPFIHKEDHDLRDAGGELSEQQLYDPLLLPKVSAARCARVSYLTHDGKRSIAKDLELYDKLVGSKPLHASALEHPARAWFKDTDPHPSTASNFHPTWGQLRKMVRNENVTELDLQATLNNKPDWITL